MKNKIFNGILIMMMTVVVTACGNKGQSSEKEMITCTISIDCANVSDHIEEMEKEKADIVPEDGIILEDTEIVLKEGTSVYEALVNVCRENDILMESSFTAGTGSAYVEGIANLYEFDCGELSGWQYCVNGVYAGVSSSDYVLKDGDIVAWRYTCDLGEDLKE